jgi:uncharacterized cupredoxin-like copper-binding protein
MVLKVSALGLAALLAVAVFASVATAATTGTHATATTIKVTAGKPTEFKFTVSKKRAKRGVVVFRVANKGSISHDFKIGKKRTKLLRSGKSAVLRVTFKKRGKYRFLCTVPGHAAAGMKGVIVVK